MSLTFEVSASPMEILLILSEYRVIMSFASLTSLFFSCCRVKKSPRNRKVTNEIKSPVTIRKNFLVIELCPTYFISCVLLSAISPMFKLILRIAEHTTINEENAIKE